MTSSPGGSWGDPLNQLKEGIDKLREFAANQADPLKKADLQSKIVELERRANNYTEVMKKRELGDQNG